MSATWTNQLIKEAEQALITTLAVPPLSANRVMEYTNNVVLTEATLLSDLVEGTYDGYARGSIASWVGPELDLQGNQVVVPAAVVTFSCSGPVTVNTVIGYGILDSTGATLLAAATYPTPISPIPGQVHRILPALVMSGSIDSCAC